MAKETKRQELNQGPAAPGTATRYPMTVARRGRLTERVTREARRFFVANAHGHCDTCNNEDVPVYREDTDEGWQECIECDSRRAARRELKAVLRG